MSKGLKRLPCLVPFSSNLYLIPLFWSSPFDDFNLKIIESGQMKNVFETIKTIQSTDKKELNHTQKNLLVAILIRFGQRGNIGFNNDEIGSWIGEDGEYIKNILSKLKAKKYLKIEGRKSNRKIYPGPKLFRDSQSQTKKVRDSQSPNVTTSHEPKILPIIKKEKKEKPLSLNFQLQTLKYTVPKDVRYKSGLTFVFKDGIKAMGFDKFKNLLFVMRSESHQDFIGDLKKRINGY